MARAYSVVAQSQAVVAASAAAAAPEIWVLLGRRTGDNLQMLALAGATQLAYRAVQLDFNLAAGMPNLLLGASRCSLRQDARGLLAPPWPRAVISSGRRAVPAARWIRARSGGNTRLVHVGRPWAPLSWFDLVITTPQYRLPPHPRVISNLMPLIAQSRLAPQQFEPELQARLSDLPRPWLGLVVGGSSRPYLLDEPAAVRLGAAATRQAAGGSVLLLPGPRASDSVLHVLSASIAAPLHVFGREAASNPYRALRAAADGFLLTSDSAVMLAELITSGKPVRVFDLPQRADLRRRLAGGIERLAQGSAAMTRLRELLLACGLLTSVRDLDHYRASLQQSGMLHDAAAALARQQRELHRAAARVRSLIRGPAMAAARCVVRRALRNQAAAR